MFFYDGGTVTRKKLEEAIDLFVKIEIDYKEAVEKARLEGKEPPMYKEIVSAYPDNAMAEDAVKQYARQIQPSTLENMQKVFYDIINTETGFRRTVVNDYLNIIWDGIGEWRK